MRPIRFQTTRHMLIKTILNKIEKFKGFVYKDVRLIDNEPEKTLEVRIEARRNSRGVCKGCGHKSGTYDTQKERRYEYIPIWGISVFFLYRPRRINCPDCGIHVEQVPWAVGKHRLTQRYAWFLSSWAKRLSWKETAEAFGTSWHHVYRSVEMAVNWGLKSRALEGVLSIGIDEIAWRTGHKYQTLVYQIDSHCKRLLWIGDERTEKTLHGFFDEFGQERSSQLEYVCSDMWKAYLNVIAQRAGQAVHILDRFHIVQHLGKAIDQVRAGEARKMKEDGYEPILTNTRWLLLKKQENLTEKQETKLRELLQYNLKTVRSYLLKEDFQQLWTYSSRYWAGKFIDKWCARAMRSKIDPMKKVAKQIRKHKELMLNWFEANGELSSGIVEGFNNKAKLTMRRAYGYKSSNLLKISLYHALGDLPTPKTTHRFF